MTGPLRLKGCPLAFLILFGTFVLVFRAQISHSPTPLLGAIPVGLWAVSWANEWVSKKLIRSSWIVYMLRSNTGQVLYVGETNDVYARALRHPTETPDAWRRDIRTSKVVRYCHHEKQAKRCEARRIRALTKAAEGAYGPPLHNDQWAKPSSEHARNAAAWVWSKLYWVQSVIWSDCCWHRPVPPYQPDAVIDPTQTAGRWDADDPEPEPDDPEDDPREPSSEGDELDDWGDEDDEPQAPPRRGGSEPVTPSPVTETVTNQDNAPEPSPRAQGRKQGRRTPMTGAQRQAAYKARLAAKQKETAQ